MISVRITVVAEVEAATYEEAGAMMQHICEKTAQWVEARHPQVQSRLTLHPWLKADMETL